tara:strand:+ start:1457 stop:1678 length:222 start_codon:yes stop_codon:yes gene_type:complete
LPVLFFACVIFYFTGAREPRILGLSCPKKTNQKKRPFFLGIFCYRKNRKKAPEFSPRLQKFLTEPSCYTEEKE